MERVTKRTAVYKARLRLYRPETEVLSVDEKQKNGMKERLETRQEMPTAVAHIDITNALKSEIESRNLRYHIISYGCQMNAHDSEKIAGVLESCGYKEASDMNEADFILFNTCCVREHAEKRVFGNIGALKKRKDQDPGLIIAVCGCMMQQKEVAERLYKRYPFVNLVFGTDCIHELPSFLQDVLNGERPLYVNSGDGGVVEGIPAKRIAGVSASINIMYGCDNFCTYCIVPFVRGRERSRSAKNIITEARRLAEEGYSEILLLGQNVNSYHDEQENYDFSKLLCELDCVEGIRRIRFMTSHPKDLSDNLIAAMAQAKHVCRHIHLPAQSGSNRILTEMNRRYTREHYMNLVQKLRNNVPGIELTTDIIVGFPGETEADFQDTLSLIEEAWFAAAFTFMYSPRTGTQAAKMGGQIAQELKKERLLRLNALQEQKTKETNLHHINTEGEVLVEGYDARGTEPTVYGKLSCFKMVYFPGGQEDIGKYRMIRVTDVHHNSLIGKQIEKENKNGIRKS